MAGVWEEGQMTGWTAEITNNPDKDFDLYIELLENLYIVNKKQENEFKQKINEIFSTEILPEANKESYEGKEEIKKDV